MKTGAAILNQSWAITLHGARDVAARLKNMAGCTNLPKQIERRPKQDYYGQDIPQMTIKEGMAVIPIVGPMLTQAEPIFKLFGFISHQDIMEDIDTAVAAGVRVAAFYVDSPGGTAQATPELSHKIAEMGQKTITASYTSGMNASAAYFASCGCGVVSMSESAIIGCVGTILEHVDISQMLAEFGVSVEQIKSGEYKGMGSPEVPLTAKQREFLQDYVSETATDFQQHVLTYRDSINPDDLQGQWFSGKKAVAKGFADMLHPSLDSFLAMLR